MSVLTAQFVTGGSTSPKRFDTTQTVTVISESESSDDATGLVRAWMDTPAAREYDGRWVLLSDQMQVLDSDYSARDLSQRHPDEKLIAFVLPSGIVR